MNQSYYHRADYFNEIAIKSNPQIVEYFVEQNILESDKWVSMALDNGYNLSSDYINSHLRSFSSVEVMGKLIDGGYRPTNAVMESYNYMSIFANENLFLNALDWGYMPSIDFLEKTNVLSNPNLTDRILDAIKINIITINSRIFFGKAKAQQKIIREKPEALLDLIDSNNAFEQFWLEAFK